MEGHKFSPKSEKQKKKKPRRVDVVQGNMSIYGNILRVYTYSVRSIAGLIVIKLTFVFKEGGLGVLPHKILQKLVQNPAILEDFISSWACM